MKILDVPQSGSLAGVTSSRNRFGQYRRTRAVPVNPNTERQSTQRARVADLAAAWRTITDAQRSGWAALGAQMVRSDSLGQSYSLTGLQAYTSVNTNLLDTGSAVTSDAPAYSPPSAPATAALTVTIAAMTLAYTVTPLPAGVKAIIYASPQRSAGRSFESDYRLLQVTAAAAASPADLFAAFSARFGAPVLGRRINVGIATASGGLVSAVNYATALVTAV